MQIKLPKISEDALAAALDMLSETVKEDTEPYVPYRTGRLYRTAYLDKSETEHKLIYPVVYANSCYYAKHPFNRRRHPHATARWLEAAKAATLPVWRKKVSDFIRANLK